MILGMEANPYSDGAREDPPTSKMHIKVPKYKKREVYRVGRNSKNIGGMARYKWCRECERTALYDR